MTHFSDQLRVGNAYYPAARSPSGAGTREDLGVAVPYLTVVEFGNVVTATTQAVCVNATATAAGTLSATGSLVTGGVATFDVPRVVSITSTSNNSGVNVTVNGTDQYGQTLRSTVAGPNNTTVNTLSAYRTVTSVTVDAAVTGNLSVGTGSTLGLPFLLADTGKAFGAFQNGKCVLATDVTYTAALSATGTPTASTADIRGTVALASSVITGSVPITLQMVVDPTSKITLYGLAPFGG